MSKKRIADIAVLVTLVLYTVAKTIAENISENEISGRRTIDSDYDYDFGYGLRDEFGNTS